MPSNDNHLPETVTTQESQAVSATLLSSHNHPPYWQNILSFIAAILILYILLISFPTNYAAIDPAHMDAGWRCALNYLANSNYLFGRDVVFTWGPLGYMLAAHHVGANLEHSVMLAITASLVLGILLIIYMVSSNRMQFTIFALCYGLCIARGLPFEYELLSLVLLLCCLPTRLGRPAAAVGIAAGAATATLAFVKFNLGFNAFIMIILSTLSWRLQFGKRANLLLVASYTSLAITFALFSTIFLKSYSNLWSWLAGSFAIASGYSVSQTLQDPDAPIAIGATLLIAFVIVTALLLWKKNSNGFLTLIALASVYLAFKHSFIRQDPGHEHFLFLWLMTVTSIIGLACNGRRTAGFALASFLIVCLVSVQPLARTGFSWTYTRNALSTQPGQQNIRNLYEMRSTIAQLDRHSADNMRNFKLPADILASIAKAGTPSLTTLPNCEGYCYANGLQWDPLPVIHLYHADTPYTDRLCANYFDADTAPRLIIYSSTTDLIYDLGQIDHRNPLLDTPLTTLALLRNYQTLKVHRNPAVVLMQHRAQQRELTLTTIGHQCFRLNEWSPVPPSHSLLLARIKLHPNPLTYPLAQLYQLPTMNLEILSIDGRRTYRIVCANLPSGILLNCVPTTFSEVASLIDGGKPNPVLAFRIIGPGCAAFNRKFDLEWLSVGCHDQPAIH